MDFHCKGLLVSCMVPDAWFILSHNIRDLYVSPLKREGKETKTDSKNYDFNPEDSLIEYICNKKKAENGCKTTFFAIFFEVDVQLASLHNFKFVWKTELTAVGEAAGSFCVPKKHWQENGERNRSDFREDHRKSLT
ncbi:MAG: hypothetical protein ACI3XY_08060 [Butyricicoccaceae bacterium]